ncbi:MAG TPA: hypothetical protein VNN08_06375, partial [Thermoanaerobaculia bacterium]|nr:hypothetical protein [Thermoanaerobaculia bacterium]
MNLPPAILSIFVLSISFASEAVANPSRTLMYVNRSADGQQLILRRDGERLVIVDQRSYTVVASAPARETAHVTVRGADDRDDTLTLDLSTPFSLAGGIDYDGGAAGWDTLVITGGSVQKERVTQRTPHDGVVDLDGLVLRYTNLEPVTDLAAASSLTVNGTAGLDAVTISDGAVAGQATISSPTFESYTFSNKTNVVFDGLGGGDSVTINNPTTPTGLANLIIQNVATVGQTAPFNYPAFGVSATGTVNLPDVGNNVTNLGIVTVNGSITYRDVDDITIGGVSPAFIGLRVTNNGSISLVTGGTMTFPASTIESGDSSGDVFLQTFGAGSDITLVSGTVQAHAGSITEISGRDINSTALVLATDFITLTAMRDIALAGIDGVIADLAHTGANATATVGRDFITNATGFKRGSFGSELGTTTLNALAGSVILDDSPDYTLFGQNVNVTTDRLIMSTFSGGMLASGVVTISSASAPVDLGSTTDAAAALEISNVEINRISTPSIVVASSPGFGITVTQPMTLIQPHALTLRSAGTITSTGSGSLNVPTLAFDDVGTTARTWTVDASSVTMSPGAAIPYSGVTTLQANGGGASDTFNVTPAPTTVINIDGNLPTPPASPGDSLNVNTSGTTSPALGYASTASGFAGGYTFGNRAAVNFQEIETLLSTATDLGVTKTDGATTATAGNTVTYTI